MIKGYRKGAAGSTEPAFIMGKIDGKSLKKKWGRATVAVLAGVLAYVLLTHLNVIFSGIGKFFSFLSPVIGGLVIAYVVNPLAEWIRKNIFKKRQKASSWYISVAISLILIVFFLVILLVALIPQFVKSVTTLISNLGIYAGSINKALAALTEFAQKYNIDISKLTQHGQETISEAIAALTNSSGNLFTTVTGIGTQIMNGVIAFIISIYFLCDKERLLKGAAHFFHLLLSGKHFEETASFWGRCNRILIRYVIFDIIDGIIIGIANAIFMTIARMPYIALISAVVGITNLAPTFGPIVGAVIGGFILVLVNPMQALVFLIFTIILQTIDGYVLKPRLFGGTLGIPGIWILICIIVLGRMAGVVGILLAIPVAAISDFVYHDYLLPKMAERRKKIDAQSIHRIEDDPVPQEKLSV